MGRDGGVNNSVIADVIADSQMLYDKTDIVKLLEQQLELDRQRAWKAITNYFDSNSIIKVSELRAYVIQYMDNIDAKCKAEEMDGHGKK